MKYLRGLQSHVLLHELVLLTQCLCLQPASHHMNNSDPSGLTVLEDFSIMSGEKHIVRLVCLGSFTRPLLQQWMMSCAMLRTCRSSAILVHTLDPSKHLLSSGLMVRRIGQYRESGMTSLVDSWLMSSTSSGLNV